MATSRRHLLQCAALALVGASGLARAQDAATFP